jgi:Trk K+ transport system NAD-binding subunit
MKILPAVLASAMPGRRTQVNLKLLKRLLAVLGLLIVVYSVLFHFLMAQHEGQYHSWFTGFYWTIVAMSTLGFGDVTFHTDLGRLFSVVVVLSGMLFMLILLPFTFIQFFYAPWLEARDAARAPRALPPTTNKHVLLTNWSTIEMVLVRRLRQFGTPFAVLVPDITQALELHDEGIPVMVGDLDDPDTYVRARVADASLVVATGADTANTNIAATVRECSERVRIVATAASPASVDILELAGCDQVLQLGQLLGRFMARRVFGRDGRTHVIGDIDGLLIAEAAAVNTRLVGQTLRQARLREQHNINVGGVWERGRFRLGDPDTVITSHTVLLLAGTRAQLDDYDADFGIDALAPTYVVIIGGGRVGRAAATALREQGVEHAIVEKIPGRARDASRVVVGDAADLEVLKEAGIDQASSVIVTTHEDDVNVYLTLYCRRLRPDMLILSRSTLERNTSTLHRVGADFVLSYPSMGAHVVYNMLRESKLLFLAEGLDVFTVTMPTSIAGRTLAETNLRALTGCNVLGIRGSDGAMINANANLPLPDRGQLILIGDRDAEQRFLEQYRPQT